MKKHIYLREERSPKQIAPPKQNKPANPILKTYWTSLISLMLCVTMFLGTTIAWFSDEVTVPYNRIDVGTLSVKLEYKKPRDEYVALAESSSNESNAKIFDKDVPWAPGYTAVREIRVTNAGSLNLSYLFTFQEGKTDGSDSQEWDANQKALAKCFEVYVKDGTFDGYSLPTSYNNLVTATGTDGLNVWTPVRKQDGNVANLYEIVKQKLTINANEIDHKDESTDNGSFPSHSFLIALHMKEEATIAMSGKELPLGAYLIAYQSSTDTDDLGNDNKVVFVQNAVDLKDAVASHSGCTIVLTSDIKLDSSLTIDNSLQLDLSGHKLRLTNTNQDDEYGNFLIVDTNGKLVIRDSSAVGTTATTGAIIGNLLVNENGTLLVNGGKLQNVWVDGGTMIMNGGVVDVTANNGITLYKTSTLALNYGHLNVWNGHYSVYAASGEGTVTVADTFHFKVGEATDPSYGKADGAKLIVNSEEK